MSVPVGIRCPRPHVPLDSEYREYGAPWVCVGGCNEQADELRPRVFQPHSIQEKKVEIGESEGEKKVGLALQYFL